MQEDDQTLDQFFQRLQTIRRDCNLQPVTAEQYGDELVRDAFIRGMKSSYIRQRLLEKGTLDVNSAYELALQLDTAQRNASSYLFTTSAAVDVPANNTTNRSPEQNDTLTMASVAPRQTCFFCGFNRHLRSLCPARDATCNACGKKGHYQKVCKSSKSSRLSASVNPIISTLRIAAAPSCLQEMIVIVYVNDIRLQCLIDTGSSESYISKSIVDQQHWKTFPSCTKISMASTALTKSTFGHCFVNIQYKNLTYEKFKLSIMSDLCADVLLGLDFLKLHEKVEIPFAGNRPTFSVCSLMAAKVNAQSLFPNLASDIKPIATRSIMHSPSDETFIKTEIDQLLSSGVIEASNSPWRAQVLVTSSNRHRKRLVIDYSRTINRFT